MRAHVSCHLGTHDGAISCGTAREIRLVALRSADFDGECVNSKAVGEYKSVSLICREGEGDDGPPNGTEFQGLWAMTSLLSGDFGYGPLDVVAMMSEVLMALDAPKSTMFILSSYYFGNATRQLLHIIRTLILPQETLLY
ncbi:hypothetical protein PG995_000842 [Apiospora arundinis]